MQPVHTRDELRAADQAAIAEVGLDTLVATCRRGGGPRCDRAVGHRLRQEGRRRRRPGSQRRRRARGRCRCCVAEASGSPSSIPARCPRALPVCDLVIDAAYGTGFRGEYRAPAVPAGTPVLAIDIPSGLDADTGLACEGAVSATVTVTMAALKPGLVMGDGPALAGRVEVAPIGIAVAPGKLWLVEDADIACWLPAREPETNKWRSACLVVAGSPGMIGAARFSTSAAQRAGAGMVRWCVPGASPDELPVSEAVALSVPATDFADAVLGELRTVPGARDRPRPRIGAGGRRFGASPRRRSRGPCDRRRRRAGCARPARGRTRGVGRAQGRQRCSHRTTASMRGLPPRHRAWTAARAATVSKRPGPLPGRLGAVVLLKGSTTAVAAPDGRVLPRHVRIGSSRDGRDRRRAVRSHRCLSRQGTRSLAGRRSRGSRARARSWARIRRGPGRR